MSRILVIDDDNNFRNVIKCMLTNANYEVMEASSAQEGLAITGKFFINLVITDLYMPEFDGVHLICQFKEKFPGLRIIAMTGACSTGRTEHLLNLAMEKGASDIFNKTDSLDILLRKVKSLLN